jgi:hypothetical protein
VDNSAFDPAIMAADLALIRGLVRSFFSQIKAEDWERPTETRPTGWTLKQAFCHVSAVAELLDLALEGVLGGVTDQSSPIDSRHELAAFNQKQIKLRENLAPEYLFQTFLESILSTERRLADMAEGDMERPAPLNVYNRPLTVAELIGNQLVHPSLVHGAQLANGIGVKPLWQHFSPTLMNRQLTRFLHIFSHVYWPERGGDLTAVVNFNIRGVGGGHWHVGLDEAGGFVGQGLAERSTTTLYFASADAFCSVFTRQISSLKGVLTGKVFAWGNFGLAFKLPHLFKPT